jgi:hypothetical protein
VWAGERRREAAGLAPGSVSDRLCCLRAWKEPVRSASPPEYEFLSGVFCRPEPPLLNWFLIRRTIFGEALKRELSERKDQYWQAVEGVAPD